MHSFSVVNVLRIMNRKVLCPSRLSIRRIVRVNFSVLSKKDHYRLFRHVIASNEKIMNSWKNHLSVKLLDRLASSSLATLKIASGNARSGMPDRIS